MYRDLGTALLLETVRSYRPQPPTVGMCPRHHYLGPFRPVLVVRNEHLTQLKSSIIHGMSVYHRLGFLTVYIDFIDISVRYSSIVIIIIVNNRLLYSLTAALLYIHQSTNNKKQKQQSPSRGLDDEVSTSSSLQLFLAGVQDACTCLP